MYYFLKLKVPFKNTVYRCWIWALIYTNDFYNLDLIEFKGYNEPTCILIPFTNLGGIFQKISITYNLGQNCWDEMKNLFFSEKTLLNPQINVVWEVLSSWQQNFTRFNIDIRGSGGEFWIWKNWAIPWIFFHFQLLSQQILSRILARETIVSIRKISFCESFLQILTSFLADVSISYALKTPESLWFSRVFRGIK